jgi:hypothetical protein
VSFSTTDIIEDGIKYEIDEHEDGNKLWFFRGRCHRKSGPAVFWEDGRKEYWLDGVKYPEITSDEEWLLFQIIT